VKPESIGRYKILGPLDKRSRGRVFLASDPERDRPVVLELLPLGDLATDDRRAEVGRQFLIEAQALAGLDHPGLAQVRDFGEDDGVLWWVTEQVDGVSLDSAIGAQGRLPVDTAIELVARAGEALGAAHAVAVTHRSIRPSRLLRVGDEGVKVVGFRPGETGADALKRDAGDAIAYLSPEQVKGAPADARSDLFSLAAVLFELLTGKRAFPGESESSVLFRIVHEPPPDLAKAGCPIDPELATFLERALSKNPADRFATAEEFVESLRHAAIGARVPRARHHTAEALVASAVRGRCVRHGRARGVRDLDVS